MKDAAGAVSRILRRLLDEKGLQIKDLVGRTRTPRPTVSRHVRGLTMPNAANRAAYAGVLGVAPEVFESMWQVERGKPLIAPILDVPPSNVAPGQIRETYAVGTPVYDALPASHFIDAQAFDHHASLAPATRRPSFIATIKGACMEPDFPDGRQVFFELLETGNDLIPGECYYVAQSGEQEGVTFKQLVKVTAKTLTLRCINREKHPDVFTVERKNIERMGVARWVRPKPPRV